jgi:hypothetical protein
VAPALGEILASPFVRGGVSGVGVFTAVAGLAELGGAFMSRRPHPSSSSSSHEPTFKRG